MTLSVVISNLAQKKHSLKPPPQLSPFFIVQHWLNDFLLSPFFKMEELL